jgi:hypothetical protein
MSATFARRLLCALSVCLLQISAAPAAPAARDNVEVHAYFNDACIIADEPYFIPVTGNKDASDQMTAKFLPLLGIVIGKLAELFINHEVQNSVNRIKSGANRKDTRYAVTKNVNLYRADFQPVPTVSINAKLGCMTIVAANLKPDTTDCTAAYVPKQLARESMDLPQKDWKTSRTDDSVENQLRRANICADGKVRAVYEARFEFSKDGTTYRMKNAGYRIDSLLTTQEKGASRTVLYTLKISQPAVTDQQEVLSSAWVNLGTVAAGARASGDRGDSAPWLRVPAMSIEAERRYQEKTKIHQEVMGEIEALKRAMTRNQRILDGLDRRLTQAGADVAEGLKQERTKVAVQIQAQGAELDARNAEYQDLPQAPLEFMPVAIEVAVTETESEKAAQLALADLVGTTGGLVATAAGNATSGLISKSVDPADVKTEPDSADLAAELQSARAHYFDALVEVRSNPSGKAGEEAQRSLAAAKAKYDEARRSLGLE